MNKALLSLLAVAALLPTTARADETRIDESRELVSLELHLGPYTPDGNDALFEQSFGDDRGPIVTFDAFFHIYRIPYVGPIGITASAGWARYSGNACADTACTSRTGEKVRMDLFPIGALATLRFDALWHEWNVPLFLQGGIGAEYVRYRVTKGGTREGFDGEFGLRWGAELGFYLDAIERRAARSLDVEYGINHSYVLFGIQGSTASATLPIADRFTWTAGLGLTF